LFRSLGQPAITDEIVATMKAADHDVRESDPLDADCVISPPAPSTPPIVARRQALGAAARETVLAELPKAEGLPEDHDAYLQAIDDVYKVDAYHSLSIEGYQVTPELIQRVSYAQHTETGAARCLVPMLPPGCLAPRCLPATGTPLCTSVDRDTRLQMQRTSDPPATNPRR